ncbi:ATP-binding cassette domain-containing protein [Arthrobacter sp.]|uniref:ABC transporter ATP-binding protein n=1 Tax=Arthrobacter sp. TaxID=1667 RepID=UPI0028112D08|nr:ATP-binding cassette domain-containing protein [Arthrobacter sp.]
MTTPVLDARIESFTFHGETAPAVHGIGLAVQAGTLTSVLGGAGSGKSTLGRLLAGWLRSDGQLRGRLSLSGDGIPNGAQRLDFAGTEDDPRISPAAWSRQVGYVPQDAAAMLSRIRSTVAEELAFGLENRGMDRDNMHRRVADVAAQTGLSPLLDRDPGSLSGGELRRLAIACCVILDPVVLMLDDPLSSLDAEGAELILDLITGLVSKGTAVVHLGQVAGRLFSQATHCLVLDGGSVTAQGMPAEVLLSGGLAESGVVVSSEELHHGHYGPEAAAPEPAYGSPAGANRVSPGARTEASSLSFRNVTYSLPIAQGGQRAVLTEVDLDVGPGQIVAITGPNGAGKSTLLRHVNGLLHPDRGEVLVGGAPIRGKSTGAIAADVGLLFQHPRDQLFERTLLREVGFGLDRLFGAEAEVRAIQALEDVGLANVASAHPHDLPASGQRLLALATVLARQPAVIALDEPTVGLDRHGIARLQTALDTVTLRGAAVLVVTHDLAYARTVSQRVLRLRGGRLHEL